MHSSSMGEKRLQISLALLCMMFILCSCSPQSYIENSEDIPSSEVTLASSENLLTEELDEVPLTESIENPVTPTSGANMAEILETAPDGTATEEVDVTVPETAVMYSQAEYDALQQEITTLVQNQETAHRNMWILGAVCSIVISLALVFLYLWRRTAGILRNRKNSSEKAEKKQVTAVSVGKAHGLGGREYQQDSFSVSPPDDYSQKGILAVVADGMGSLKNSDEVSQLAVTGAMESFLSSCESGQRKLHQILKAAKENADACTAGGNQNNGGSTIALGLIENGLFYYLSVGDSRICLYRNGAMVCLTRDHSYQYDLQLRAVNGEISFEQAYRHSEANCITSYLGMGELRYIDFPSDPIAVLPGDKLILMTDGVYNALSTNELCLALMHPAKDAAEAIESFIHTRNYPNQDNYTAVIIECLSCREGG